LVDLRQELLHEAEAAQEEARGSVIDTRRSRRRLQEQLALEAEATQAEMGAELDAVRQQATEFTQELTRATGNELCAAFEEEARRAQASLVSLLNEAAAAATVDLAPRPDATVMAAHAAADRAAGPGAQAVRAAAARRLSSAETEEQRCQQRLASLEARLEARLESEEAAQAGAHARLAALEDRLADARAAAKTSKEQGHGTPAAAASTASNNAGAIGNTAAVARRSISAVSRRPRPSERIEFLDEELDIATARLGAALDRLCLLEGHLEDVTSARMSSSHLEEITSARPSQIIDSSIDSDSQEAILKSEIEDARQLEHRVDALERKLVPEVQLRQQADTLDQRIAELSTAVALGQAGKQECDARLEALQESMVHNVARLEEKLNSCADREQLDNFAREIEKKQNGPLEEWLPCLKERLEAVASLEEEQRVHADELGGLRRRMAELTEDILKAQGGADAAYAAAARQPEWAGSLEAMANETRQQCRSWMDNALTRLEDLAMRTRERLVALTQEVREARRIATTPSEQTFEEVITPFRQQLEALSEGRRLSEQAAVSLEARLSEGLARLGAECEQLAAGRLRQASSYSPTSSPHRGGTSATAAAAASGRPATGLRTPRWSPGRRAAEDGVSPTGRQRGCRNDWVASLRFEPEKHGVAESPPEAGGGGFTTVSCGVHGNSTPWRNVLRQPAWQLPGTSPPSPHATEQGNSVSWAESWAAPLSSPSRARGSPPPSSGSAVPPVMGPAAAVAVAAAAALAGRSPSPPTAKRLAPLQLSPVQQVSSRVLFPVCDEHEAHISPSAAG